MAATGPPIGTILRLPRKSDRFNKAPRATRPSAAPICSRIQRPRFNAFELTFPGQSGSRNTLRGDGFFTIDAALSKRFRMFYNEKHSFQIRAEAFNVTNSVRFDVNQMSLSMSNAVAFGKYNGTLNTPRVIQFGGRYEF